MGNILTLFDASDTGLGKALTFLYDDLYRLTTASTTAATSTPFLETYSYSSIGNITNKSDLGTYTYNDDGYNNPHAADSINSVNLAYDNVENVTSYGSNTFAWDYRNRLIASAIGSNNSVYLYDHNNDRVARHDGQATTTFANRFHNVTGATTTNHIYLPDGTLLASVESTETGTNRNNYELHPH
jgi:hypothetical protein